MVAPISREEREPPTVIENLIKISKAHNALEQAIFREIFEKEILDVMTLQRKDIYVNATTTDGVNHAVLIGNAATPLALKIAF